MTIPIRLVRPMNARKDMGWPATQSIKKAPIKLRGMATRIMIG
jgi:hypothetical protein